MHDLSRVASGDAGTFDGFQGEKTVGRALRVPDGDGVRRQLPTEQGGCEENGPKARAGKPCMRDISSVC